MQALEYCVSREKGLSFQRTEEGKTFRLKAAQVIECDIYNLEQVFENEPIRHCDWLFVLPKNREQNKDLPLEKPRAYYVELKGTEHRHACEQLFNTIDKTKAAFPNFDLHARLVSNKGQQPELLTNEFYKKIKRIIRKDLVVGKVHKGNRFTHTETI